MSAVPFADSELEQRLRDIHAEDPNRLLELPPDECDYILKVNIMTSCSVCGEPHPIIDRARKRVRYYCSRRCSAQAKITRKWQCIICHRRFRNSYGAREAS